MFTYVFTLAIFLINLRNVSKNVGCGFLVVRGAWSNFVLAINCVEEINFNYHENH